MKENRINTYQFLPLVELLWDENIRKSLKLLQQNNKIGRTILEVMKTKKINQIEDVILPFIPTIGSLKWNISQDTYHYLLYNKHLIYDNQPVRPIVPLSTNAIRWEFESKLCSFQKNPILKVRLYPLLCVEIERSTSFESHSVPSFLTQLKELSKICYTTQNDLKLKVFDGLFEEYSNINIPLSNLLLIVETNLENYQSLDILDNIFETKRLAGSWIKEWKKNHWLIVYGNSSPNIKLRLRLKTAIKTAFMISCMIDRVDYLLSSRIDEELYLSKTLDVFDYIASVLNPQLYSANGIKSYLLPKYYQRKLFSEIMDNIKGLARFDNLKTKILDIVEKMDPYEQCTLLNKNSIGFNILKSELDFSFNKVVEPDLPERESVLLDFFINEFFEIQTPAELKHNILIQRKNYAGKRLNYIRENIKDWLKKRDKDESLISKHELKENPPELLIQLVKKDLIIMTEVEEDSRESYIYSLNVENPVIRKRLFGR